MLVVRQNQKNGIGMKLRTDSIGHFDNPTEKNIRDAVVNSEENDIVKLMVDDQHYISIWAGRESIGHILTLKSEAWKLDSIEKLSSEIVVELMVGYLHNDLSMLKKIRWTRPIDKIFIDNIMKLKESTTTH